MKKKILSFCLAFAVIVPAIFLLSACGGGNDTPKKDRTNTAEIVSVYQDYGASLYVEMTGFEHDEYELTGSSRHNLTLEFSINNGEWFECEPVQVFMMKVARVFIKYYLPHITMEIVKLVLSQ